jgi:hypothetical protein
MCKCGQCRQGIAWLREILSRNATRSTSAKKRKAVKTTLAISQIGQRLIEVGKPKQKTAKENQSQKHQKTPSSKGTVSVSQLVEEHNHIHLVSYPYTSSHPDPNPNAQKIPKIPNAH